MARQFFQDKRFLGISDSEKEGLPSQYFFARSVDYRSDPTKLSILPKTAKSSGSTVVDLPMWGERQGTNLYVYGNAGHIYKKTSADAWTDERTVATSSGNGIRYFGEDDFLYYTSDKVIGRYGPIAGTPSWADDFLGAQGGVPLNTHSLVLASASSQYASRADTASLSITGNITLEAYIKPTTLPASGSTMTLISKWDESGALRSYKMDILGVAGIFGDGSDGALTISTDTTEAPIDSAATATSGTNTISATNASFAVGQKILLHQSRGSGAGTYQVTKIEAYTAGTITTVDQITATYISGAQVRVLKQYTDVTVNASKSYTAKAWDGTVGGILAFLASGTVTVNGSITASNKGYRGGTGAGNQSQANCGEGTSGASAAQSSANGSGGGGGKANGGGQGGRGGGGGHSASGESGSGVGGGTGGTGGGTSGNADLSTMTFGGAGGGGGADGGTPGSDGGDGGGIIMFYGNTVTLGGSASITSTGEVVSGTGGAIGGAGAGGSILVGCGTATLGTTLLTATGGNNSPDGDGSTGRIAIHYATSYTGTTDPTINATLDSAFSGNLTYQLRISVSADGTTPENLAKIISISTGTWRHIAISWVASTSVATFYLDGVSQGTVTGTLTAIHNNASTFQIGMNNNSTPAAANFFNGGMDSVRVWNLNRTTTEIFNNKDTQISTVSSGLQAYYKLNNDYTDSTTNANDLTASGSPTFSASDVPFASPTTRLDIDQTDASTGSTYTMATSIAETATHRQTFVPAKDPQKSILVNINTIGTGNWTLTVHDAQNRVIVSKTVTNGSLNTGNFEFTFASVWRPIIGASYHFHLTSTVANGIVVSGSLNDLETGQFTSYFQFLVEDDFHPIYPILNKIAIGNERYVGTWNGITYSPHAITLPSGYRVRCLGEWREYLAIGVTRGTDITSFDEGKIFFWDGSSTTYNFYINVPQGGINAILSGDPLVFVAGYSGNLMEYSGGKPRKLLRFPKMTNNKTMEVYPGGIAMWRALIHIGIAGDSDSTAIEKGVYAYGTLTERLSETLSYDYPVSTGTRTGTGIDIGMVFPMGSSLFIGWKDGVAYGVDVVKLSANPFTSATYESLIRDANKMWSQKEAYVIRAYFKALASGDTVTLKYKTNRNSSWTSGSAVSTADKTEARLPIPTKSNKFDEFQFAADLATSNATSPELYSLAVEIDDRTGEKRV